METKRSYIIALDQGTTSSRCIVFSHLGEVISTVQKEFKQIFPQPGWVEHDPMEIYASQYSVMIEAIAKCGIKPHHIKAIGITNQRETTIVWDKKTGKPIYNAIVWQCRRTEKYIKGLLEDKTLDDKVYEKTGLRLDPYFSASKIKWILDNVEGAKKAS